LITGFNTFLPPGYHIEITNNPLYPVHVTTPNDPTGYTPIVNVVTKQIPIYQQAINPGYPYSLQRSSKVISTVGESVSSSTAPTPPSLQPSLPPHHPSSTPIADTVTTEASPSDAPPKHNMEFNHAINYVNKIKVLLFLLS
jgi:paired amphipathic helix protein Sin3a